MSQLSHENETITSQKLKGNQTYYNDFLNSHQIDSHQRPLVTVKYLHLVKVDRLLFF